MECGRTVALEHLGLMAKLQTATKCNPLQRFRRLLALYRKAGFVNEARWMEKRIAAEESGLSLDL